MKYCPNKKSAVSGFLVMVLIITAGFVVIFFVMPMILGGANIAAADSMCRGSVALRDKTYTDISPGIGPVDVDIIEFGTPLLCKTSEFTLPEDKNADEETIKKEIAELIVSCWFRYGEGLIENVFKTTGQEATNRCQVCYIVNLRETTEFKRVPTEEDQSEIESKMEVINAINENITMHKIQQGRCSGEDCQIIEAEIAAFEEEKEKEGTNLLNIVNKLDGIFLSEFTDYLHNTPYKLISESDDCKIEGGFCIKGKSIEDCGKAGVFPDEDIVPSDMIIDEASSVCRKKGHTSCCYTDYGCLNRGGICISDPPEEIEEQYTRYNDDVWGCPTDEYCFVKNENHYTYGGYVQSFGGEGLTMVTTGIYPGETYAISFGSPSDTCGWCNLAKKIGAGIGAASVIAGGAILVATGVVASPFTLGASLGLTVVGTAVVAGGVAGATAGFVATALATNAIHHFQELFTTRNMNTVYFTTLKQLQQDGGLCSIIESV